MSVKEISNTLMAVIIQMSALVRVFKENLWWNTNWLCFRSFQIFFLGVFCSVVYFYLPWSKSCLDDDSGLDLSAVGYLVPPLPFTPIGCLYCGYTMFVPFAVLGDFISYLPICYCKVRGFTLALCVCYVLFFLSFYCTSTVLEVFGLFGIQNTPACPKWTFSSTTTSIVLISNYVIWKATMFGFMDH